MSKQPPFKKVLVRNPKKPLPKTTVLTETKKVADEPKKVDSMATVSKTEEGSAFEFPELYSALKLSKKFDGIVNYKKKKSTLETTESKINKLALDEKVTRKVNFPYNQPIYKDLIQISAAPGGSQTVVQKRPPMPQKDKEPNLADFSTDYKVQECFYRPEIPVINCVPPNYNSNLRLYSVLQTHNQ